MILGFNIGFLEVGWVDIIDILFVAVLLYQVYKLMKGSVAIKVFLGFLILYLIYLVVNAAQMELLSNILGQFMGVGVIAAIILFQPEIRKFLLLLGRAPIFNEGNILENFKSIWTSRIGYKKADITPLIEAAKTLGGTNTGALIVLSKNSELKFFAESGDRIDAVVSKRLLMAIFNKYSPLHDGAVIIYDNKIIAARCILPVTERDMPAQFGLRHRAALGMSENTDTLVIVVSEETGQLSTMRNGEITHNLSTQELRKAINEYLYEESKEASSTDSILKKAKEEGSTKKEEPKSSDAKKEKESA
ncbi:diadenylate cyclase CdaA [Marinoscillum pacificum]|uniref:diadenylate cyclase CdaA n=1 Tax=Marinoscillum pacificum TaxID=392723 RepID=UPI0021583897|nr:diadenylate cyclase CdaA [Marinoscillum pacificum]